MPVDTPHLWNQIRLGEDTDLELKEVQFQGRRISAPHRRDLADEFAAFANARGGSLVLGVADDRTPQVLTPEQLDRLMDVVSAICADSIKPALDYDAYRVPCREGGVLLIEIPASEVVHRSPGGYYRRQGDTKRQGLVGHHL